MAEDPDRVDQETPDHALGRAQLRALLERKIDELPQDFRSVFVMRALEEMTAGEVAELLNIPEATVRTRFFRARAQLSEALARDIDFAMEDAFSFDGVRCDRIVARVLRSLSEPHQLRRCVVDTIVMLRTAAVRAIRRWQADVHLQSHL